MDGRTTGTDIAPMRSLRAVVDEYQAKLAALPEISVAMSDAVLAAERGATVGGTYAGSIWGRSGAPAFDQRTVAKNLLVSAWKHVYAGLGIDTIAPLRERERFEREISDPPEFTLDNIAATFGDYIKRPRHHILRGLAEIFVTLDPAYRSHEKMKIGVAGLPKRVILSGFGDWSHYGRERVKDILNALAAYQGQPQVTYDELSQLVKHGSDPMTGVRGVWLKRFQNGNGHLFFGSEALRDINRALADFYGDVLPDAPGADDDRPARRASTEVSKDLQFYPTPQAVIDSIVGDLHDISGKRALEPSCGDGRIMLALRAAGARVHGVEVDPARAATARAKGLAVTTANFLDLAPTPDFDLVVMNPPFYGRHYAKHVTHAARFLRDGGRLIAILPVTARDDHGLLGKDWLSANGMVCDDYRRRGGWEDLPVGSFSESGTNINTVIFRAWRRM